MSPTRRVAALAVLLLMLTLTGCGNDDMGPTITLAQATARVDQMIREAFAQLPAGAQLRASGPNEPLPCEGAGGMDTGQVLADLQYTIVHPDSWPADQLIEVLDRYWKTRGYELVRDDRTQELPSTLFVRDKSDDTAVGIQLYRRAGGHIDAYLVGDSGCVWENGTPPTGS